MERILQGHGGGVDLVPWGLYGQVPGNSGAKYPNGTMQLGISHNCIALGCIVLALGSPVPMEICKLHLPGVNIKL